MVFKFDYQSADHIDAYADTDWAGCPRPRRSKSGGCIMVGTHLLKCWSSAQAEFAMSSGEAEFYGAVKGASTGLGMKPLYRDIDYELPLTVDRQLRDGRDLQPAGPRQASICGMHQFGYPTVDQARGT